MHIIDTLSPRDYNIIAFASYVGIVPPSAIHWMLGYCPSIKNNTTQMSRSNLSLINIFNNLFLKYLLRI